MICIGRNHLDALIVESQDILRGTAEHRKELGHQVHHMELEDQDQGHVMVVKIHISQEEEAVVVDQEDMVAALHEVAIIAEVSVAEAEVGVVVATMIAEEAVVAEAALALVVAENLPTHQSSSNII